MQSQLVFRQSCHVLILYCVLLTSGFFAEKIVAETTQNGDKKLFSDTSFALEMRVGTILWSGVSMPTNADGTNPNVDGINGKNFLYPVMPILGIGARFNLAPNIHMTPALDLLFDEYVYRADLDRAFRTQNTTGNQVGPVATVAGFLVSLPVWFDFKITNYLLFSISPGLSFFPRIALIAIDGSTEINKITNALNREFSWLYPQTGLALDYAIGNTMSIGVQVQVQYPVYHLWSTNGLPFQDSLMINGTIGFDFYL